MKYKIARQTMKRHQFLKMKVTECFFFTLASSLLLIRNLAAYQSTTTLTSNLPISIVYKRFFDNSIYENENVMTLLPLFQNATVL